MRIAVDFDGTIVTHEYPAIGRPVPFAIDVLKRLQSEGHELLLWTFRTGPLLDEAVAYCHDNGVDFYAVNKTFPEEDWNPDEPRKIDADIYIDDKNIGGLPDWGTIYRIIKYGTGKNAVYDNNEIEFTQQPRERKSLLSRIFGK